MKNKVFLLVVLLTIAIVSIIVSIVNVPLADNLFEKAGFVFTTLFLIALIIERGLDVFLTNLRASESEKMQNQINEWETQLPVKPDLSDKIIELENKLHDYKADTRMYAMRVGLIIGILVSAVGIRSLQNLIDPESYKALEPFQQYAINVLDIFLTGAVLAGGSDSIHKMMNAFRLFMEKK